MDPTIAFGASNSGSQVAINHGQINNQFYATSNLAEQLPMVHAAAFDSLENRHEDECLQGTRTDVLYQIREWAFSEPSQGRCIFWLNGMAGTGKSTISRTAAKFFSETKTLGATFFFKSGEGDRGNATKLFPTIAGQLVNNLPTLKPGVQKAVQDDPRIAFKGIKEQFDKLLHQPLLALVPPDHPIRTSVIIIDALDECENEKDIQLILQLLPQLQIQKASIRLQVLLTSRPELPIRLGFRKLTSRNLVLHEISNEAIEHDLSLFFRHRLSDIREERDPPLPIEWPGVTNLQKLVALSMPLFIFAATICRVFEDPDWDPQDSLPEILAYQHDESKLDGTYLPVLNRILRRQSEKQRQQLVQEFHKIVGAILILENPLSVTSLSRLIEVPERTIYLRLNSLHSVLSIPDDKDSPVRLFHLSFRNFMLDPKTCSKTPFWVDKSQAHHTMTIQCLRVLCQILRKNICELQSDGTKRAEVDRQTINKYLPLDLQYACRYWAFHFAQCTDIHGIMNTALSFLGEHFLHWVEALSLLGFASEIGGIISTLQMAISVERHPELSEFLRDARRFIHRNHYMANKAPLQIYCAGLIFTPHTSIIRTRFEADIPTWLNQLPQVEEQWSPELEKLEEATDELYSHCFVAFSPDGRMLASGSGWDDTALLWDTVTGVVQRKLGWGDPLNEPVDSMAFSPDSQLLACAGRDGTVYLWDTATGALRQVIKGHQISIDSVDLSLSMASGGVPGVKMFPKSQIWTRSVAFSPDGQFIAGTRDNTLWLWNIPTGALQLQQTLEDHLLGPTLSVAFSPNGRLLASSSWHCNLYGYQAQKDNCLYGMKEPVCLPYTHGTLNIDTSVLHVDEGDWVMITNLWDMPTGTLQRRFEIQSGSVTVVCDRWDPSERRDIMPLFESEGQLLKPHLLDGPIAFSPDSRLLASGSHDKTVYICDTSTGVVQQTLKGHSGPIKSVAFSPKSQMLASGSEDRTVCLWDTSTGALQQTLDGHLDGVRSVSFSPNGCQLASSSYDGTIRLWDTKMNPMQKRLVGHSSQVDMMAFSPNGRLLASGSCDQAVCKTTILLHAFSDLGDGIRYLKFSNDGSYIMSNNGRHHIPPGVIQQPSNSSHENLEIFTECSGQWVKLNGKDALWLPPDFRPSCRSAVHGGLLALGHQSGRVSFIGFRA
ncbi:hypothetical protein N7466_000432 [Penicillium verhagenii]|uniref:uncharacterized protein n=1 Tax=Penicillium verhagenii TaxID=1562060 RepID=UPI002544E0A7|nr:uncharacterized protein N7466_000432 [Penicillium verhagenii]KAJ5947417.1 hypothetical protein N7466_000432 [Penicillium verhagenii]